jgi:hypothetical protein
MDEVTIGTETLFLLQETQRGQPTNKCRNYIQYMHCTGTFIRLKNKENTWIFCAVGLMFDLLQMFRTLGTVQ